MAPKKTENGTRPNRIRFVMLEADISDGNLTELTQAITSALRTNSGPVRTLSPVASPTAIPSSLTPRAPATTDDSDEVDETPAEAGIEETVDDPAKSPKTKSKPPLPTYLPDLDLKGSGVTFKEYVGKKGPTSHSKRYLVAALWLKEYGNSSTITVDKIFTCYKTVGWPLNITDWDVNFRNQVKTDRFRRVGSKEYEITPLGEADLQDS
jgi:hypothetical protein